ncbi:antitoxin [Nakamurella aerolata]|uniref:Antitoxin n=1 Tax=Nakamurella aerolata TaxID=1656892 RepID=A0A849AAQ8_9ACTN|nr:antitoxin [Nakamurella aerolata]NNG37599.1 antitoxin [Nakamurella aerolata]
MVDFGGLADKAKDFVGDNADKIKDGIKKAGDAVGNKVGHDKVDGVEEKLTGLVDKISRDEAAQEGGAAGQPAPNPQAPQTPPAQTPPAQAPQTPPAGQQ